jgi:hypothetical protein
MDCETTDSSKRLRLLPQGRATIFRCGRNSNRRLLRFCDRRPGKTGREKLLERLFDSSAAKRSHSVLTLVLAEPNSSAPNHSVRNHWARLVPLSDAALDREHCQGLTAAGVFFFGVGQRPCLAPPFAQLAYRRHSSDMMWSVVAAAKRAHLPAPSAWEKCTRESKGLSGRCHVGGAVKQSDNPLHRLELD